MLNTNTWSYRSSRQVGSTNTNLHHGGVMQPGVGGLRAVQAASALVDTLPLSHAHRDTGLLIRCLLTDKHCYIKEVICQKWDTAHHSITGAVFIEPLVINAHRHETKLCPTVQCQTVTGLPLVGGRSHSCCCTTWIWTGHMCSMHTLTPV